jgi:hypothetical protein
MHFWLGCGREGSVGAFLLPDKFLRYLVFRQVRIFVAEASGREMCNRGCRSWVLGFVTQNHPNRTLLDVGLREVRKAKKNVHWHQQTLRQM